MGQVKNDPVSEILIVGLGNPGTLYQNTRHNAGFEALISICEHFNVKLKPGRGEYYLAKYKQLSFLMPTSYMNNSGVPVYDYLKVSNIPPSNMIVMHDDMDIENGRLRMRWDGGTGGHKGIESIVYEIQSEDFWRIKIGIGKPLYKDRGKDYVLSKFSPQEQEILTKSIQKIVKSFDVLSQKGLNAMQAFINTDEVQ